MLHSNNLKNTYMKKKLILRYILVSFAIIGTSCSKDFLDNQSKENLNDATQFASENNADIYLNDSYSKLWKISNSPDEPDLYTDDCDGGLGYWPSWNNWKGGVVNPWTGVGASAFNYSNPESGAGFDQGADTYADWPQAFQRIRRCNTFIQQVNVYSSNFSNEWKKKRIDEARFLRAFTYTYLFMHYGALPVITHPQSRTLEGDSAVIIPRSTFEETYNFIISQLDSIVNNNVLPAKYSNGDPEAGRATLGAALALKGWVELFAASPAYNSAVPAACNGTGATAEQVKLTGFGNYDVQRWAKAAATNKQFMDTYEGTYQLFPDMNKFWTEKNEYNSEIIFDRQLVAPVIKSSFLVFGGGPCWINGVYYNWGNFCPTQELVDDFGMANGLGINDPGSGYDPQNPYVNRDPRFYTSIVFDGAIYKMDWMPVADTIYTRIDKVNPSKNQIDFGANDVSNTAYYSKKRVNPAVAADAGKIATPPDDGLNYVFLRYTEVILNYAEAQNESVGPDASVYAAIDKLRERSGTATLEEAYGGQTLSQIEMREVIHRERRVELCFENKRIYDILRWGIAEVEMNHVLHGMKISNTVPADNSGTWTYKVVPLELGEGSGNEHPHVFLNKMYALPIPQMAIDRNSKLIQNPGY
jgi:hypothetical protein